MHINPVLNIEMKRHARTLKCCWVFFGVNLLLGFIFLICYLSVVGKEQYLTVGHYRYMVQCYVIMAYALFGMLCLLLPGIAGSAITREREKNTLDILLSTQLSPFKIVWGKLQVSLWMLLLIILSAFPMISIIMVLGEVSLLDLLNLTASIVLAGIFIGSISIFCSSICKASNRAVLCSYVMVLGITVGTIVAIRLAAFLVEIRMEQGEIYQQVDIGGWIYLLLCNPLVSFFGFLSKQVGNGSELLEICNTVGNYSNDFVVNHMCEIAVIVQMLIAGCLLYVSAKRLCTSKK